MWQLWHSSYLVVEKEEIETLCKKTKVSFLLISHITFEMVLQKESWIIILKNPHRPYDNFKHIYCPFKQFLMYKIVSRKLLQYKTVNSWFFFQLHLFLTAENIYNMTQENCCSFHIFRWRQKTHGKQCVGLDVADQISIHSDDRDLRPLWTCKKAIR